MTCTHPMPLYMCIDLLIELYLNVVNQVDDFDESIKENRSRAFLKIQDGCNYRCSFCIKMFAQNQSDNILPKLSFEI